MPELNTPGGSSTASGPAAFLQWLIAMDDPNDVIGRENRRHVTLTEIIQRAKDAVSTPNIDTEEFLRDRMGAYFRSNGDIWRLNTRDLAVVVDELVDQRVRAARQLLEGGEVHDA